MRSELTKNGQRGISALMPRTRTGRVFAAVLVLCCVLGLAYVVAASTPNPDRDAKRFIQKYQYVDQSAYRAKR